MWFGNLEEAVNIDVPARLKTLERGIYPDSVSAAQWGWIKPRITNWLYARQNMDVSEKQYYEQLRYLVAQCPIKDEIHAS